MTDTQVIEQEPKAPPAAEPLNVDNAPMIPKTRFDEVNSERNALREQLAEFQRKQQADEQAKLEEQGEFQKLAEERQKEIERLASYEAQVTQLTEAAKASNEKLIEQVPEDKRGLIPEYEPLKLQQWLAMNQSILIGQPFTPPSTNGGAGTYQKSNGQHKPLTQTEIAIAKKMNLTPEQYQEAKAKIKG